MSGPLRNEAPPLDRGVPGGCVDADGFAGLSGNAIGEERVSIRLLRLGSMWRRSRTGMLCVFISCQDEAVQWSAKGRLGLEALRAMLAGAHLLDVLVEEEDRVLEAVHLGAFRVKREAAGSAYSQR